MELFERRLFALNAGAQKPVTGTLRNEIMKTATLGVLASSGTQVPLIYNTFLDFKDAEAFDGATLVAVEVYLNDQYLVTYLIVHPQYLTLSKYVIHYASPGHNRFKIKVIDSLNQISEFSNEIVYNMHHDYSPSYNLIGPDFFGDTNTDPNIHEDMIKIYKWEEFKNVLYTGDSDVNIEYKFNSNPGQVQGVGHVTLTLLGNKALPETFVLPVDNSLPNGFLIQMDSGNINRRQMWDPTGLIGFKVEKVNCVPGTTVSIKVSARHDQGTQFSKTLII